jgi:nickel-dependent lactate racemase
MTTYRLPYDRGFLDVDLGPFARAGHEIEVVAPRPVAPAPDPVAEVEVALERATLPPYRGGGCAIAINDATRPIPHDLLLPPLVRRLERAGVAPRDILFLIATGTHAPVPASRFGEIVQTAILERYRVASHDAHDETRLVSLGDTSRGTPIWVNREYLDAAMRLVVGGIEPHQFVGFSGGVKSAVVGLGGSATIVRNHSMMTHPLAQIGRYDDNPVRQDMEDMGARIGVHLALNVILGEGKRIVRALAGPPVEVMRQGIPLVRSLNQVEVSAPFDVMIVSPGGHPKDINLYQAQKALAHAALVTRPGGTILLAAACPEGTGSQAYEQWMGQPGLTSHEAVIRRFSDEGYRIGPHKAFQISRDASRFRVLFHSGMEPAFVTRLLLTPVADVQGAVDDAVGRLGPGSRIGVMPRANATIPVLAGQAA